MKKLLLLVIFAGVTASVQAQKPVSQDDLYKMSLTELKSVRLPALPLLGDDEDYMDYVRRLQRDPLNDIRQTLKYLIESREEEARPKVRHCVVLGISQDDIDADARAFDEAMIAAAK